MGKYAIINGHRVALDKAKKMTEAAMPREGRLYESLLRVQARLNTLRKEGSELLSERENLLTEMAADFPKTLEMAKQSAIFKGEVDTLDEAIEMEADRKEDEGDLPEAPAPEEEPPAPEKKSVDYSKLERKELMELCDEKGIEYKKNTPTDRLIQWLNGKGSGGSHAL